MSKATDFKFVARVHVDIFSKWTNKNPLKGRGLVTLIICSINKKAFAGAKVTYDSSAYMKAPMAYSTNLSSTGNPTVKTIKAIPRNVIKPLTYLFHRFTFACL